MHNGCSPTIDATILALEVNVSGHHRLTLCGADPFDTTRASDLLGWLPQRGWHETS